jgi:HEAT repeats
VSRRKRLFMGFALVACCIPATVLAAPASYIVRGWWRGEPSYRGMPASFWHARVQAHANGYDGPPCSWAPVDWAWLRLGFYDGPSVLHAGPETVPVLSELLGSDDIEVRLSVIRALCVLREDAKRAAPALVEAVCRAAMTHPQYDTAGYDCLARGESALDAIGSDALPFIVAKVDNPAWEIRKVVCEELATLGVSNPEVFSALHKLLRDEHYAVRLAAAWALSRLDSSAEREVVSFLLERYHDSKCPPAERREVVSLLWKIDAEAAKRAVFD